MCSSIFSLVTLLTNHQTASRVLIHIVAPVRVDPPRSDWHRTCALQAFGDVTLSVHSMVMLPFQLIFSRFINCVCFQASGVHIVPNRIPRHLILKNVLQWNGSNNLQHVHCRHMSAADSAFSHGIVLLPMPCRNLSSCSCHIVIRSSPPLVDQCPL